MKLTALLNRLFTPAPPRRPDKWRAQRERAQALAREQGVEIEPLHGGGFNVWPPASIVDTDLDPHAGDHYCQDWDDVLGKVQAYNPPAKPKRGPAP